MKNTTNTAAPVKVTVVAGADLLRDLDRHREQLRASTGLRVSMSAAACALIRAGLAAQRSPAN